MPAGRLGLLAIQQLSIQPLTAFLTIMNLLTPSCLTVGLLGWALAASADVLELKNGQVLSGKYLGGTANTIRFESASGTQVIETDQAVALTFIPVAAAVAVAPPPAAAPTTPAPAPAATAVPTSVSVPAGTTLLVRMVDGASSNDPKGKRFTTTLETDLVVGGMMVAKAGTKIYGRIEGSQSARRFAGQSTLDLRLTEVTVGGSLVPILTGPHAQAGAKSMGKTVKGAAAGAAIGAIADGGDGAAKGAAIGAVASGLKKGQAVGVTPGTLLEFQLQQPMSVTLKP
jgi:hypothetical protein